MQIESALRGFYKTDELKYLGVGIDLFKSSLQFIVIYLVWKSMPA